MDQALRGYRRTRGGGDRPLPELRDFVAEHGIPGPRRVQELAAELALPEAEVRAALSYYDDLGPQEDGLRVCRGTSCLLAGADRLLRRLDGDVRARPVYCLGYCDRSPALLAGDGRVRYGEDAGRTARSADGAEPAPSGDRIPLDIRSSAPEAVVVRRAIRGQYAGLVAARSAGAYEALADALRGEPERVLEAVEASGVRGRGGAGFPTGAKWRICADTPAEARYVVANGDEGDPGSFVDRVLLERDPHAVLEGLLLCGYAVGASRGVVFVRSEYPRAVARMRAAVEEARAGGFLGASALGTDFSFDVTVVPGLGSYVCGEETAMLNAIEGYRGEVRVRPPYPAREGLYGLPTVVNNVETLANVPFIVREGPEAFASLGTSGSSGTKVMALNHGFSRPGLVEVEFGTTLETVIEEAGGGGDGRPLEAVILGGPMGSVLTRREWDVPISFEAMDERGIQLGHGGIVALPEGTDYGALLEHWLEFMCDESCGKCVPCSLGSRKALEIVRRGSPGDGGPDDPAGDGGRPERLGRIFELMEDGSLCGFGQFMPGPMRRILELADGAAGGSR